MENLRRKNDIGCIKTHEKLWDKWLLEIVIFNEYQELELIRQFEQLLDEVA